MELKAEFLSEIFTSPQDSVLLLFVAEVLHLTPIIFTFKTLINKLCEEQPPEMTMVPLSKLILEIKLSKFGTPLQFLVKTSL